MNISDYESKLQQIQTQLNKLESLQKSYVDTCNNKVNVAHLTNMLCAKLWHPVKVPLFVVIAIGVVYLFPRIFYTTKYKEGAPIREKSYVRIVMFLVILYVIIHWLKM